MHREVPRRCRGEPEGISLLNGIDIFNGLNAKALTLRWSSLKRQMKPFFGLAFRTRVHAFQLIYFSLKPNVLHAYDMNKLNTIKASLFIPLEYSDGIHLRLLFL